MAGGQVLPTRQNHGDTFTVNFLKLKLLISPKL